MTKYSTYAEYLKTPEFRAVREAVLAQAAWLCRAEIMSDNGPDVCLKPATEVHHVQYCRWGEFDTPENLIAVCHECHENAHRCDDCGDIVLKAEAIKAGRTTCWECYCRKE